MEQNTLGVALSYYREKYQLNMEEVCNGICSVTTLSRVENGQRVADSLTGELLLGRIGKEANQFELVLDDNDYTLWQFRNRILASMELLHYDEAQSDISRYLELLNPEQNVHRQFCLFQQGKIKIALHAPNSEICSLLRDSLFCTGFHEQKQLSKHQLYNPTEIELITLLIHYGNRPWAEDPEQILLSLLAHTKQYYSQRQKEQSGLLIIFELIRLAEEKQNDMDIISYTDTAIDLIAQGRSLKNLAELHFTKAKAIWHLYHSCEEWNFQKKHCMRECLMSYYTFQIMKQELQNKDVINFCEEKLEWHITDQEILFD